MVWGLFLVGDIGSELIKFSSDKLRVSNESVYFPTRKERCSDHIGAEIPPYKTLFVLINLNDFNLHRIIRR